MGSPTHYLRANERTWSPQHVGFLDTETRWQELDAGQLHHLRLWCYAQVDRRPKSPTDRVATFDTGRTGAELASCLHQRSKRCRTLWIWAHNLDFDITTSDLVDGLCSKGWDLRELFLAGRHTRAHFKYGERSIWLLDSWSWLCTSMEKVGQATGRPKLPMPDPDAPDSEWVDYCANDVRVLADSMLSLLQWWDDNALGSFSHSGPACGWNAMRHLSRPKTFLIRPEPDDVAHDRSAIRGGRRDVTRIGRLRGGPFAMLDFEHAYLSVARHCRLPTGRLGYRLGFDPDEVKRQHRDIGLIAECELWTDVPRYPVKVGGEIIYPVGHFKTVLAQPEIDLAMEHADLVRIGPGFRHRMGLPLVDWAKRAEGWMAADDDTVPPAAKLAVKQWTRSVVGKFAGRSSTVRDCGPALWPAAHLEKGTAGPDHVPLYDLHIGGHHWIVTQDGDSDNAYPAVLAWVESTVRVALARMLEALGPTLWISADTDGALVDLAGARRWLREAARRPTRASRPDVLAERLCEALAPLTAPLVPRVKLVAATAELAGPQHFRVGDYARAAGRAKAEPGRYGDPDRRLVWPGLASQLSHGHRGGYLRVEQRWTDPRVTARRWILKDGTAIAPRAELDADGHTRLVPWDDDARNYLLGQLADDQAPALLRAVRRS